ncbi:MAG: hypothetical protein ACREJC_00190, partial [Tepidisphaeraceae bacterium]
IKNLTFARDGRTLLGDESVSAAVGGAVSNQQDTLSVNLDVLSVKTASKMLGLDKSGDGPFTVSVGKNGSMRGNGAIDFSADIKRLDELAQAAGARVNAPQQPQLRSGLLKGTLKLARGDSPQTKIDLNAALSALTVAVNNSNALENEQLTLDLSALAPDDADSQPIEIVGKLNSAFVTSNLKAVKLLPSAGSVAMLQSADVQAKVPDLPKLWALLNALSPPAAVDGDSSAPLLVTGGGASLEMSVRREADSTNIDLSTAQISKLVVSRGQRQYRFDREAPISLKLAASVVTDADKTKPTAEQIKQVEVRALSGDVRVATLSMPQPIRISGSLTRPNATGEIRIVGKLDDLMPLLSVLQDKPPMPYSGEYSLSQKVSSVEQDKDLVINLQGSLSAPRFAILDNGKPAFEDQIEMKNDVGVYLDSKRANIRTLTLAMPKTNAIAVDLTGRIANWDTRREVRETRLNLKYDLEKLWQIAFPLFDPEMQKTYKELKVAGKFEKTFNISGAFPARPTVNESFASLNADGSLGVELLDLPQGLSVQNFDLPFKMDKGVIRTSAGQVGPAPAVREDTHDGRSNKGLARLAVNERRSAAEKTGPGKPPQEPASPKTAWCNTGALDLDGVTIDLTSASPLVSIAKNKSILRRARLNPVLANTLGGANLLFKDADEATGLLDVTVVECEAVPVADLIGEHPRAKASIVFNVSDLKLDGPVPGVMSQVLNLGGKGIQGNIRKGSVSLANGTAKSDFAVDLTQEKEVKDKSGKTKIQTIELPLKFNGGVVLATGKLQDFFVNIPSELIPKQLGGRDVQKVLPTGLRVPFTGTTDNFKFDFQKALVDSVGNNVLSPEGLGGLLDQLGGGKKKKK